MAQAFIYMAYSSMLSSASARSTLVGKIYVALLSDYSIRQGTETRRQHSHTRTQALPEHSQWGTSVPCCFLVVFPIFILFAIWSKARFIAWHLLIHSVVFFAVHSI